MALLHVATLTGQRELPKYEIICILLPSDAVSGSMIPVRLTPPTQRSPRNSPIMFNKDGSKSHSRPHTPNLSLRSDTTDESDDDDDSMDSPPPRVLVRRFTLADPLMMPGT